MIHYFWLAFFILCNYTVIAQSFQSRDDAKQPPSVFDTRAGFTGWKNDFGSLEALDEIRIGIFVSDDPEDYASRSAYNGADLAVSEINAAAKNKKMPYRLIRRWEPDPWKGIPKEIINLVYQDSVVAIVGSADGSSTHITEQIVTKAWIPLLSPISADPTLNYTRIPWMFRLPPGYDAQAELIAEESCRKLLLKKIGIITATDHDGRIFAMEIQKSFTGKNVAPVFHLNLPPGKLNPREINQRLLSYDPQALIVHLPPADVVELLSQWPDNGRDVLVFLPWLPGLRETDIRAFNTCDIYSVQPFSAQESAIYSSFFEKYAARFAEEPSPTAAYAYDAIFLLKHALDAGGANRLRIREVLAAVKTVQGVSGDISWDNGGGNRSLPVLRLFKKKSENR